MRYIIDTSVVRSIPTAKLVAISNKVTVCVSNYTFFELAQHLDEDGPEYRSNCKFVMARGHMAKLAYLSILCDPLHSLRTSIGLDQDKDALFNLEPNVLTHALPLIESSNSYTELEDQLLTISPSGQITYGRQSNPPSTSSRPPSGNMELQLTGFASAARADMDKYKELHVSMMNAIVDPLKEGYKSGVISAADLRAETAVPMYLGQHVETAIRAICRHFPSGTMGSDEQMDALWITGYPYLGYTCERVRISCNRYQLNDLRFDPNDRVDALICGHLDVMRDDVLVTNDLGLYEALKSALDMYPSIRNRGPARCGVIRYDEFLTL